MPRVIGKIFNIWVKCPKCGREGKVYVRLKSNSKECYVVHIEYDVERKGSFIVTHAISCLDLDKQGINTDELARKVRELKMGKT